MLHNDITIFPYTIFKLIINFSMEGKAQFVGEVQDKVQKLWDDFVRLNSQIEGSMHSITVRTGELMAVFKDAAEDWVNEIISAMKKMTAIMNQCEIITKEFKQIEQIAKQT